jgi:hypothetical protein
MRPVVPARSQLNQGDWLVVPERLINQQQIELDPAALTLLCTLTIDDPIPLRTVSCYYGGHSPLEHREGPRLAVHIHRVRVDFTPSAKY